MRMKKSFISLLLFAAVSISGVAQGLFPAQWKFQTGDSLQYADPLFNDFEWKTISPYQVWERQGYATYDGFAWYRVTFVVPSSLKKDAFKYGGLLLNLGRIDDVEVYSDTVATDFTTGYIGIMCYQQTTSAPVTYCDRVTITANVPTAARTCWSIYE